MYSINDLLTFVSVAQTGGLSPASRALGISVATTSHRIRKLEDALNIALFHRNSRSVRLTDEGQVFLERVEGILTDLSEAEREAGSDTARLRGHLRVTMSPWILSRFIMPQLADFQRENPELTLEFLAVDRYVSLVQEGQDCAIRVGQMPDSALPARKLADNDRIICAAPSFLEEYGVPCSLDDLRDAQWICLPWQTQFDLKDEDGRTDNLNIAQKFAVSNSDMLTGAAVQGLGLAVKSRLAIQDELQTGALEEIMPGSLQSPDAPISIVFATQSRPGRKTWAFANLAKRAFSIR